MITVTCYYISRVTLRLSETKLKEEKMNRKEVSAIAWAISSCIFLWLFSLGQTKTFAAPPNYAELFQSFIEFSFMLLGGSACYHFLTEIIATPFHPENLELWKRVSNKMIRLMLILMSVPLLILIMRDTLSPNIAWILSFIYLLIGIVVSIILCAKIGPLFIEIRNQVSKLNSKSDS